jgi:hypothetical protein
VTLLYFAAVDFLYIGRLASFIAILEQPDVLPTVEITSPPPAGGQPAVVHQLANEMDRDELILSDLPNLIQET